MIGGSSVWGERRKLDRRALKRGDEVEWDRVGEREQAVSAEGQRKARDLGRAQAEIGEPLRHRYHRQPATMGLGDLDGDRAQGRGVLVGRKDRPVGLEAPADDRGDQLAQMLIVGHEQSLPAAADERRERMSRDRGDDGAEQAAAVHAEDEAGAEHDATALQHDALQLELCLPVARASAREGS